MSANGFADVALTWDQKIVPLTPKQAQEKLHGGTPRLAYSGTNFLTRNLKDGEEEVVAKGLRQFFRERRVTSRSH